MVNSSNSKSNEQQAAEVYIAGELEKRLDCNLLRGANVILGEEVHIEPDLYSEENKIICEIYGHIGDLKVGQKHKVSQDILKMLLLEKVTGAKYRKIIVVADDRVKKYLEGKSFIAESIRQFEVEVISINLPDELRNSILAAQVRQTMVNTD